MIFGTITLILFATGGCNAYLRPGSCSRICTKRTYDVSLEEEKRAGKFLCSCSPSCEVYRDCCYDSPYRKDYWSRRMSTVCLPLTKSRHFLAVRSCPRTFRGTSDKCENGTWNLSPVTSRKTGITYANIYCALCNDDDEEAISWNAKLSCCTLAQGSVRESHFMLVENSLWKVLVAENDTSTFCECRYNIDQEFLDRLEVRPCERDKNSTCSTTWKDANVYSACRSYIDPVHIQGTIYRNLHCAMCNYLESSQATCPSFSINDTHQQGLENQQLASCSTGDIQKCFPPKGRLFSFSEIFHINVRKCLPPPGSRCCVGQQYDFRRKRCRNTVP